MAAIKEVKGGQQETLSPVNNRQRLLDLGLLYASKSGSIVVGMLILPLFTRMLGPDLFGVVALIYTLQAFLLLLDFGMSTVVGRDLAIADATTFQRYTTWRAAEWVISLFYAALTLPVLLATWAWRGPVSPAGALGCLVLFWSVTLQNIGQNALLARHKFTEAALIQVTSVLARNGLTAIALAWISPTLTCFVFVQAVVSVAQMLATRWRCIKILRPNHAGCVRGALRERAKSLLRTGRPLMLFGLSGAAVMQLDKVIVSGLMSPSDLAPYFLATTFCLTPISVLAAPVAQYFQPRIIRATSSADPTTTRRTVILFTYYIAVCALLPTAAVWLLRDPLIALWLHNSANVTQVALYSGILLPGIAIGALGYVPYTVLVSRQDYPFQAKFSLVMTTLTLGAVMVAASQGSVLAICIIYALYHSTSTIGSWWRCIRLGAGGSGVAAAGAQQAALLTLLVIVGTGSLAAVSAKLEFFTK